MRITTLEAEALECLDTQVEDREEVYEHNGDEIALQSLAQVIGAWLVGAVLLTAVFFSLFQMGDDDEDKINRKMRTRVTVRVKVRCRMGVRKREFQYAIQ